MVVLSCLQPFSGVRSRDGDGNGLNINIKCGAHLNTMYVG